MPRRNRRDTGRRREFVPVEPEPSYEDLARALVAAGKCSPQILDPFGRPAPYNGRNPA